MPSPVAKNPDPLLAQFMAIWTLRSTALPEKRPSMLIIQMIIRPLVPGIKTILPFLPVPIMMRPALLSWAKAMLPSSISTARLL